MQLELGNYTFDVSTSALVLATSSAMPQFDDWSAHQASQGADALRLGGVSGKLAAAISRQAANTDLPIIAACSDASTAQRCLDAGASAIDAGTLCDPAMLLTIETSDASVLIVHAEWVSRPSLEGQTPQGRKQGLAVTVERARWAEAAGIPRSRIIVEAPLDQVHELAPFGYVVSVSTDEDDETQHGQQVAAVMAGARVIRSNRVRATKRTVSTIGELLQRRGVAAPNAAEFAGSN